jgi:SLOG in TRPM, prokaryote
VTLPFRIEFATGGSARAVQVTEANELRAALDALGLCPPRPTVVVVGGAAGLQVARLEGLRPMFAVGIVPVIHKYGAVGVDGGTRFGVMRLFGEARAARQATFTLVGVVADGPVKLRRDHAFAHVETALEPNHTDFVFVPGDEWGAEAPWIARTATVLAGTTGSITILINGGQIAYSDIEQSIEAGRPVVVISGSGGTADVFAAALTGSSADERAARLVKSGLIRAVPVDEPAVVAELLNASLGESSAQ